MDREKEQEERKQREANALRWAIDRIISVTVSDRRAEDKVKEINRIANEARGKGT